MNLRTNFKAILFILTISQFAHANSDENVWVGLLVNEKRGKVMVDFVYPNSPAEKANFKRGDVIISVNDRAIANTAHLVSIIRKRDFGRELLVKVKRDQNLIFLEAYPEEKTKIRYPFKSDVKVMIREGAKEPWQEFARGKLYLLERSGGRYFQLRINDQVFEYSFVTKADGSTTGIGPTSLILNLLPGKMAKKTTGWSLNGLTQTQGVNGRITERLENIELNVVFVEN